MTKKEINVELREKAIEVSKNAHSPYSKAKVGCSLLTEDGHYFSGCNVENSSFGATVCAERNAICQAVAAGHKKLKKIYIYTSYGWPPCGICRQVMTEFADPNLEIIVGNEKGEEKSYLLKEAIPFAYVPEHMEEVK